jgi:hypothetical protein
MYDFGADWQYCWHARAARPDLNEVPAFAVTHSGISNPLEEMRTRFDHGIKPVGRIAIVGY